MKISEILAVWYEQNKRDLPWRNTKNPYKIWVSEIILQQTRVAQGFDYYLKFIDAFPDIRSLANAEINDVLRIWQGLGYYSRAGNMHLTAKEIILNYNGQFPEKYEELLKLKGIGKYTAAAIASLAFNFPVASVDGNVLRVISRLFAIRGIKNQTGFNNEIERLAALLLNNHSPGQHNQALIELGAMVCTPLNPKCTECPLKFHCLAFSSNVVHELPLRYAKKKSRERFFYYYYIIHGDKVFIQKRNKRDIWQSLYELPLYESSEPLTDNGILEILNNKWKLNPEYFLINSISETVKHVLSHQILQIRFISIILNRKSDNDDWMEIEKADIGKYAFPIVIANFLKGKYQ